MEENVPPSVNTPPPPPPPPVAPPPVIQFQASPPPPRRGRGWMIIALILFVFLAISVLYNVGTFASNLLRGHSVRYARAAGPRLDEVIYEDNDAASKIAIIEVDGIITGRVIDQSGFSLVDLIKAQL